MGIAKIQGLGVLLLIGFGGFIVFLMYNSLISVHRDAYTCYGGKHYMAVGDRERILQIGSINVFYQPLKWDCRDEAKYDSKVYKVENGELVPKS